ncbi:MAG: hypothetical protein JNN05_11630 [Candidatus Omnitrophica bacterium]|nr:hypothetical protein [Candidatus Omnitrophota bacterium]
MRKRSLLGLWGGILFICVFFSGVAQAATYYVRTDGGTSTQCTGATDAPYSGSGTNQACAFNHPFWVLSPAGSPNKMVGGDTLVIGPGQYMMGLGAPNTPSCSKDFPWDCRMRTVPSGTSTSPTRILGKGWDSGCSSKPQLWGTERASTLVDLTSSSNVQIQCVDITDHSSCMDGGPDILNVCNRTLYPYGPWALFGIVASDSNNVLLKNVKIHGLRTGILAGRLSGWTLEKTDLIANSFVGWDGDIGATTSSNTGSITFKDSKIMWNGCGESYPDLQPHHCYSQDQGGYGDGLGTNVTGGDWVFDNVDFSHNVSDGLDLLYHNGQGSVKISHSRFEGNAGNQVKVAASTNIDNSKLIGNCAFFLNKLFTSLTGIGFSNIPFNNCRAGGNTLAVNFRPGMSLGIYNSTVTGNGDVLVQASGSGCVGTEKITSQNNIYVGGLEFNTGGSDVADLYYAAGAGGNGDGPCGKIPFSSNNDIIWATKYNTSECTGTASFCVDPKIVGPLSYTGDNQNVALQSTSPAIGKGKVISSLSSTDFNNYPRGSVWDIGAVEYGSVPSTPASGGTATPVCGNSVIETNEECDGAALNGKTCASQGFTGGILSCTSACKLNTASCTTASTKVCGNGTIETGEVCDGKALGGKTCSSLGFSGGTLACLSSCQYNTSGCTGSTTAVCGNKIIEPGEQCEDGYSLNGHTCTTLGFTGGSLGCNGCRFTTGLCTQQVENVCGNKVLEGEEQCETGTLNGETCTSLGFSGGSLGCTGSCKFNTNSCAVSPSCGDARIDPGEQCDLWRLNRKTCQSLGYTGGTLRCSSTCGLDTSLCTGPEPSVCGNGKIEGSEECEKGTLNGQTCGTLGFDGGALGCSNCKFSTGSCTNIQANVCGNKILEKGEQCEVGTLNGYSCSKLGFSSGTLGCTSSCQFNLAGCK